MSGQDEFIRLMHIDKNAGPVAHEARAAIAQMPSTLCNFQLVLEAAQQRLATETWGDFDDVLCCLNEACKALEKVYATDPAEMAEFVQSEMEE